MIIKRFPDGKCKAVTLSYDDGVAQDIRLVEIMSKYGIKGTFNVNTGLMSKEDNTTGEGKLSAKQMLKLYKESGNEVAVHGYIHSHLEDLPADIITDEVLTDRKVLEELFDTDVRGMAYPYGTYNDTVIDCLKACGIAYSRTVWASERFDMPINWLELHPTCHHNHPKLFELAEQFIAHDYKSRYNDTVNMFYLWGHTYEFDNDNNWDRIEKFCEYMGGRDDIWYATNIEIYDYMQAVNQLRFNVAKTTAYNPTSTDVWFSEEGKLYKVPAGETIKL
ncbi:MAG: polysaccharide deacetylase family protein [Eubacteriales bacterium]|nr:polysaccharide deacetylase family protein [Eubacteriales bacterium]